METGAFSVLILLQSWSAIPSILANVLAIVTLMVVGAEKSTTVSFVIAQEKSWMELCILLHPWTPCTVLNVLETSMASPSVIAMRMLNGSRFVSPVRFLLAMSRRAKDMSGHRPRVDRSTSTLARRDIEAELFESVNEAFGSRLWTNAFVSCARRCWKMDTCGPQRLLTTMLFTPAARTKWALFVVTATVKATGRRLFRRADVVLLERCLCT